MSTSLTISYSVKAGSTGTRSGTMTMNGVTRSFNWEPGLRSLADNQFASPVEYVIAKEYEANSTSSGSVTVTAA